MAFNFWEAQKKARSRTKWYILAFILLTGAAAYLAEFGLRYFSNGGYHPPYPFVGFAFIFVTFLVAIFNYLAYKRYGGKYVAESMNGYLVKPDTQNFQERQLLNIVEEVAIASGQPVPSVYIIEAKEINAFAAGLTKDSTVIGITHGTLNQLNREELKGVIAHEFGHIYSGDMRISLQLAAMVMGFFFVFYIGFRLIQFSLYARTDRRGSQPLILAALAFFLAGIFTYFFGSILKAMVSRQREYLADACAVQFTRTTDGIANALRKIAKTTGTDMPKSGMAYSHMYFNDRSFFSDLFATHPPIGKRISALEGKEYFPEEWK